MACEHERQVAALAHEVSVLAQTAEQIANIAVMLCEQMGGNQMRDADERDSMAERMETYLTVLKMTRKLQKDCEKRLDAAILKLTK